MKRVGVSWALSRPVRGIAGVLLWLGMPVVVQAQADSGASPRIMLQRGERVRLVVRPSGELIDGELVWQTRDSLVVHRSAQDGRVSDALVLMDDVVSAQRWAGHHSGWAMAGGFGLGLLAGLPIGMLGVQHDVAVCERRPGHNDMCGLAVLGFPIYVVGSGLVSFAAGVFHTTHRWEPVIATR